MLKSPGLQWCHQVVVTDMCWPKDEATKQLSACSNCTRALGHFKKRSFMTPEQFSAVLDVAIPFLYDSPPCPQGRRKVLGIFGGEPLMSPYFPDYVNIACERIPEVHHRGLWTSFDWKSYSHPRYGAARPLVEKLLSRKPSGDVYQATCGNRGFLNWNMHLPEQKCQHQPVLVSISDVVRDEKHKWELIQDCWVQREWSGAYALDANDEPKFYFCEVASSFDRVMGLGIGLPLRPGVWADEIKFEVDAETGVPYPVGTYAEQIKKCCTRCGAALPMQGRLDREWRDDISTSNLVELRLKGSPMVLRGDFVEFTSEDAAKYAEKANREGWQPQRYIKKRAK